MTEGEAHIALQSPRYKFYYFLSRVRWGHVPAGWLYKHSSDFRRWWGEAP